MQTLEDVLMMALKVARALALSGRARSLPRARSPTRALASAPPGRLQGADPYQLEILMRKRGDYRPHQEFGINLSM
eukprot:6467499-Prymnesium_polylepis.1